MASKRVLLTGASGFISAWVLKELLDKGYIVRATVRSVAKQEAISKAYADAVANNKLSFAIVPDIAIPGAHDNAVKAFADGTGLDFVIHTASPYHFNVTEPKTQMLDPAIQGTRGLLESVKQFAPTVRRVVITSSFASILDGSKLAPPGSVGKVFTEKDWNPISWETASTPGNASENYRGSKTFAEKAAWEFVETEKPAFELATMCPPMVFGPVINDQSMSSLNTSNQRVWGFLSGQVTQVPPSGVHLWIDVRDLAAAHVAALEAPNAGGHRFFTVADEIYSNQDLVDILRKNFPSFKDRITQGVPGASLGLKEGEYFVGDNSKSKQVLGITYRKLEDCIVDTANSLLELEKSST